MLSHLADIAPDRQCAQRLEDGASGSCIGLDEFTLTLVVAACAYGPAAASIAA
jgi:hypothetical protein